MEEYRGEHIFSLWFSWHFFQMPAFLFSVWRNYLEFAADFFSAPILLATLFSPWRKYSWRYPRGFNFKEYANTFLFNLFSRLIGATCRIFLIVASIIPLACIFFIGAAAIIGWFLVPLVLLLLIGLCINS